MDKTDTQETLCFPLPVAETTLKFTRLQIVSRVI